MDFDMGKLSRTERYKIIGACITPRPIAWVSTRSASGTANLAPFSFFNAMGDSPPVIAIGMVAHPEKRLKDTPSNIRETGEFVVNLVGEWHAEHMNLTSVEAPAGFDENAIADLDLVASSEVAPQRIAAAPVSFECRTTHFITTGAYQVVVLGEILHAHVRDEFVLDAERMRLDIPSMKLIARLHGAGWYGRQTDIFEMLRPNWSEVEQRSIRESLHRSSAPSGK